MTSKITDFTTGASNLHSFPLSWQNPRIPRRMISLHCSSNFGWLFSCRRKKIIHPMGHAYLDVKFQIDAFRRETNNRISFSHFGLFPHCLVFLPLLHTTLWQLPQASPESSTLVFFPFPMQLVPSTLWPAAQLFSLAFRSTCIWA